MGIEKDWEDRVAETQAMVISLKEAYSQGVHDGRQKALIDVIEFLYESSRGDLQVVGLVARVHAEFMERSAE